MPDRLIQTPTGVIRITEDGQIIVGQGQAPSTPSGPLAPPTDTSTEPGFSTGREMAAWGANMAAAGASFIPGVGPLATAARVAAPVAMNMGANMLRGDDASKGASWDAGLSLAGEGLSRSVPYIGNALAIGTGGLKKGGPGLLEATKAFVDDASTRLFPRVVGRTNQLPGKLENVLPGTKSGLKQNGQRLQDAEYINPVNKPLEDMVVAEPNTTVRKPVARSEQYEAFNNDTLTELAIEKQIRPHFPNASPAELREIWNGSHIRGLVPANAPPGHVQKMIKDWQRKLIKNTTLTQREVGELKRGESATANRILEARRANQFVPEGSAASAEISEDFMTAQRNWQHDPKVDIGTPQSKMDKFMGREPKPGQAGSIKAANDEGKRLHTMSEISEHERGLVTGLGGMATRSAALAAPLWYMGVDPITAAAIGAIGLSPEVLSGSSIMAGRTAKYAPGSVRALEASNGPKKKEVKRRTP